MSITLNGKPHETDGPLTVAELLDQLGLAGRPVVVELDLEPLSPGNHATAVVGPQARVEIITLAAGG